MKKVLVKNVVVNYIVSGESSNPVVLVLHGWGTQAAHMKLIIDNLSGRFRVIAPDLPGFGGSEQPSSVWKVGDYALFVKDFLEKLGVESVYAIAGHSFGGRVAIVLAGRKLLVLDKLVLIDSAGVKQSGTMRNRLFKFVAKAGKLALSAPGMGRFSESLRRRLYASAGSLDYIEAGTMRDIFLATIREDLLPDAHAISVDSLLVWGENDTDTPVADAQRIKGAIEGSKLVVIPNAGHFVYLDDTARTLKEINQFL